MDKSLFPVMWRLFLFDLVFMVVALNLIKFFVLERFFLASTSMTEKVILRFLVMVLALSIFTELVSRVCTHLVNEFGLEKRIAISFWSSR